MFNIGYCSHPITVYSHGNIKGYIEVYYYPTVTGCGLRLTGLNVVEFSCSYISMWHVHHVYSFVGP